MDKTTRMYRPKTIATPSSPKVRKKRSERLMDRKVIPASKPVTQKQQKQKIESEKILNAKVNKTGDSIAGHAPTNENNPLESNQTYSIKTNTEEKESDPDKCSMKADVPPCSATKGSTFFSPVKEPSEQDIISSNEELGSTINLNKEIESDFERQSSDNFMDTAKSNAAEELKKVFEARSQSVQQTHTANVPPLQLDSQPYYNLPAEVSEVQQPMTSPREDQTPPVDPTYLCAQYEQTLQQMSIQLSKLLGRNQELEQNRASNEFLLSQNNKMISDLKQQLHFKKVNESSNMYDQIHQYQAQVDSQQSHIHQLTFDLQAANAVIEQLREEVQSAEEGRNELWTLKRELQRQQERDRQTKGRMNELEEELIRVTNELAREERRKKEAYREVEDLKLKVHIVKEEKERLERESNYEKLLKSKTFIEQSNSFMTRGYRQPDNGLKQHSSLHQLPKRSCSISQEDEEILQQQQTPVRPSSVHPRGMSPSHGAIIDQKTAKYTPTMSFLAMNNKIPRYSEYSPVKKSDPNVPYAYRQKLIMSKSGSLEPTELSDVQGLTYENLMQRKKCLETEFSKLPITISKKTTQQKAYKDQIEFELSQVEKELGNWGKGY